jgi:hypothetical protein
MFAKHPRWRSDGDLSMTPYWPNLPDHYPRHWTCPVGKPRVVLEMEEAVFGKYIARAQEDYKNAGRI